MKKLKSVFWIAIILLLTTPLASQSQTEWSLLIEPVYMSMYNDFNVGDEYTFYVTELYIPSSGSNPKEYRLIYGMNYDPVVFIIPHKTTVVWEINNKEKNAKLGFGIRGWGFRNSIREGNTIITPLDEKYNEDGSRTVFVRGFRMIDYVFQPFNEQGDMPIDWWAKNYVKIWTREIYAFLTFSNTLSTRFGVKVVDMVNKHDIGQRHWTHEDRNRTYKMTSEVNYLVLGPNIGFDIRTKRFALLIQQSALFSVVRHLGHWGIYDYIIEADVETGHTSQTSFEVYSTSLNDNTSGIIPTTELNIKLLIKEKKFARNRSIKFGCSLFTCVFWQTPVAPRWEVVTRDWYKKRQDLVLSGMAISMEIKF